MASYRLQCNFQLDTALPRDAVQINPCFQINGALQDPGQLAQDLADALATWSPAPASMPITVKAYEIKSGPDGPPAGVGTKNANATPYGSQAMREVSLCLSFYADQNTARRRGRLFVPALLLGSMPGNLTVRPTGTPIAKVAALVPIFAALGGVNVDWIVYSRLDGVSHKVSDWYVDDEWDVQRSRGLKPTTKTKGSTSGRSAEDEPEGSAYDVVPLV